MDNERQPDPDLASELRQGAGREWNEEAAEDERLTELHRRRRMTLADQAKELANRGDRVSVEVNGHTFSGRVASAGEDYVVIEGPGQVASVLLAEARWSVLPDDRPGEARRGGAETFRALLHEHSASLQVFGLALPGGDMVTGSIEVVAVDHVVVSDVDERRQIVPTKLIRAVVRSSDHL